MKYVVAILGALLIWVLAAFLVSLALVIIATPPQGQQATWQVMAGTIVGLLAAVHSARATLRKADAKDKAKDNRRQP